MIGRLLKKYNGDIRKALWAYNAGEGNVAKNNMPSETKAYIPKVMNIYNTLKYQSGTQENMPPVSAPVGEEVGIIPHSVSSDVQSKIEPENRPAAFGTDILYRRNDGKMITANAYNRMLENMRNGKYLNVHNESELQGYLRDKGWVLSEGQEGREPQTSSNQGQVVGVIPHAVSSDDKEAASELSAGLQGNETVPRGAEIINQQIDPDSGMTQYRADGDNSPVTWRNASGNPMRTSSGQLFTQKVYEDWAQKADAGRLREKGINSRAELDSWLEKAGMHISRPSEERGVNNLNGRPSTNLPPDSEDTNIIPYNTTPGSSPEKYPAPSFTDELNETTPADTQELLNALNGIADERYSDWTKALRRYYPSRT